MREIKKFIIEFLKVIADPTRLEILELLRSQEKSSAEIQEALGKSQSTISQHLSKLLSSNLIDFNKKEVLLMVDNPNKPGEMMEVRKEIKYFKIKNDNFFKLFAKIMSFVIELNKKKIKNIEDFDVRDTLFDLTG